MSEEIKRTYQTSESKPPDQQGAEAAGVSYLVPDVTVAGVVVLMIGAIS